MSSSLTARTSTTGSSTSSSSRAEPSGRTCETAPVAVIACGALSTAVRSAARRFSGRVEVHVLPPLLHNRPDQIPASVEALAVSLRASGRRVAVAYADCGTYGALDAVCESLGLARLPGLHCYEVLAGEAALADLLEEVPGTYILTDFLIGGFSRLVERSLGLDRHPELIGDYFGHYERIVWLSEHPTGQLRERAAAVSKRLGLPVVEVPVGPARLEAALIDLIAKAGAAQ